MYNSEVDALEPPKALSLPQVFIDAGDVPWIELQTLLALHIAQVPPGRVLEVQSGDPATIMALPGWCAGEGYTLIHAQPGNGYVSFWIGR